MKFCKDCKHFKKHWGMEAKLANCMHPDQLQYDLVTGEAKGRFCDTQRQFDHMRCGPDGKLWEAKQ